MPRELKKQEIEKEENINEAEEFVTEIKSVEAGKFIPKTSLGKDVVNGKITSIDQIFESGRKIIEPEIVDILIPNISVETILIGGSTGKGGGIRRTPIRRTTRMHKSGRRYRISIMVVVGNGNGYIGVGFAKGSAQKHKEIMEKAIRNAKLNIFPVLRGCGNWECRCGTNHSIPFAVSGKSGSVRINLFPAPKGVGLVASDEIKKIFRLAGIKDIWCKSRGKTATRINHIYATIDALKELNRRK
ncbi:MAG: 30S ribosomal protein S5 [Candidatus Aenigmatarchaeota archaeon]